MLTILSGTNRPDSNTRKVVSVVESIYSELGASPRIVDLAELPADIFLPSAYAEKPAAFAPFSEAILASSGLVVVTPEYNGGPPGVLKYFIDMLEFPESFEKRPVCFIGVAAGQWGALRPVEQLQTIFGYRNAHLFPERIFVSRIHEQLDEEGRFKEEKMTDRFKRQAEGFLDFIQSLNPAKSSS